MSFSWTSDNINLRLISYAFEFEISMLFVQNKAGNEFKNILCKFLQSDITLSIITAAYQ